MTRLLHGFTILALITGGFALANIRLYKSFACGGEFIVCPNVEPGFCCYGPGGAGVFGSCEAVNPRRSIQSFGPSDGRRCGTLLGGSQLCWGASSGRRTIGGCRFLAAAVKRSPPSTGCNEATHHGKDIGNATYMMDMSRDEYQGLLRLLDEDDDAADSYLMEHADVVE